MEFGRLCNSLIVYIDFLTNLVIIGDFRRLLLFEYSSNQDWHLSWGDYYIIKHACFVWSQLDIVFRMSLFYFCPYPASQYVCQYEVLRRHNSMDYFTRSREDWMMSRPCYRCLYNECFAFFKYYIFMYTAREIPVEISFIIHVAFCLVVY